MSSYPQHPEKWQLSALLKPQMRLEQLAKRGYGPHFKMPSTCILCYKGVPVAETLKAYLVEAHYFSGYHFSLFLDRDLAVLSSLPLGGPATAVIVEELAALGARRFLALGQAGSLQSKISIGDLVVCTKALRDEGVSHHYLPPARFVDSDQELSDQVYRSLSRDLHGYGIHRGATWTTDAVYRETAAEVEAYRSEGIDVVEMEAAALLSVAHYHQLKATAVFTVSDQFKNIGWEMAADWDKIKKDLGHILARLVEMKAT